MPEAEREIADFDERPLPSFSKSSSHRSNPYDYVTDSGTVIKAEPDHVSFISGIVAKLKAELPPEESN